MLKCLVKARSLNQHRLNELSAILVKQHNFPSFSSHQVIFWRKDTQCDDGNCTVVACLHSNHFKQAAISCKNYSSLVG